MTQKIVCVIPARGGSKGIPNKNIIEFNSKPLIAHSIEQAINANLDVYVSSDSDEILQISTKYGAKGIKRPETIAGDTASSESALLHAIETIEYQDQTKIDICVFLQATSPLREPIDIKNAIKTLLSENLDSVFSACVMEDMLVWQTQNDKLQPLNYDFKNRKRRQDHKPQYIENGSIYVFKRNVLFENKNRLGGKIGISLMDTWKLFEIDNYSDLDFCSVVFKTKKLGI